MIGYFIVGSAVGLLLVAAAGTTWFESLIWFSLGSLWGALLWGGGVDLINRWFRRRLR